MYDVLVVTFYFFLVTERENELNDNDITNLLDNMGADEMKKLEQWFMAKNGLSTSSGAPPPPPPAPTAPTEVSYQKYHGARWPVKGVPVEI